MELVHLVILAAFLQYMWFGWETGALRVKHGVDAPATAGQPEFDRMFRVHQNTLEQLIVLVPSMLIFANYLDPRISAALGATFVVARVIYRKQYLADPKGRAIGFVLGYFATAVLVLGAAFGAVRALI